MGHTSETDIHVTAVRPGEKAGIFHQERVILEIKGCWHQEIRTAMQTQLLERHMTEANCSYGVYVVGWYGDSPSKGRKGVCGESLEEVKLLMDQQANSLSGARQLRAVVFDASRPAKKLKADAKLH